jgi:hypothetical protein
MGVYKERYTGRRGGGWIGELVDGCAFRSFHTGEDSSRGFLGCDTV